MKELNLQQLENLEGGKRRFWGTGYSDPVADSNCPSGYSNTATYYILGIAVSSSTGNCMELGSC